MARSYTQTHTINATPHQIHAWLADWDHVKAWMGPTLVSIEILSDHPRGTPICAGMRFRETRKMGKMNAKAIVTVERHEIDADGVFHHRAVFDDGCNRMVAQYRYEPDGEGTRAIWTISTAPNKWWTRVMNIFTGSLMIKMCAKHEADHLQRLGDLIERNPTSAE